VTIDWSQVDLADFCKRHGIRRLALFGSVLTPAFGPESDVDVLVEFAPGVQVGYLKFAEIQHELSELLGREVDLNTAGSLSRHFRNDVVRRAEVIYEQA
jgi:predicted nucleotidyltransferase